MAGDFLENPVKVGKGLETYLESDFTDAQVGIEKQILRFFNPHAGDIVGEVQAGHSLEHFAEIEAAGVHRFGYQGKREVFRLMGLNVFLGAGDDRWLGVGPLHEDLIADNGQVLRKDCQQLHNRIVVFGGNKLGVEVNVAQLFVVNMDAPLGNEAGGAVQLRLGGGFAEHLTGLQEANQPFSEAHGDCSVG